ncbi:cysteine desulfuration protein SufE [Kordiimonas sediminis]|uniref:Cysteine desulfuration protein SufE n=1 Tax=Kordiimonas sediminis TaxID=1735581 RepID=A0A919ANG6_9PROT|nr:SufE family protein [Kordiimonas sediminis]GHF16449.1 cysteine desulfuration protein SufE [Kordiimonas sediminis]
MDYLDTTIDDVIDTFEFLDDWEDKYRFIIDLGRKLPPLDASEMTEETRVRGCQSQVWLVPELDDAGTLSFRGDSDAHIVKGLVALMLLIHSGKTPKQILDTDAKAILGQLDLSAHLSPMRANGLFSMLERIRTVAAEHAA